MNDFLTSLKQDIMLLTETWFVSEFTSFSELLPTVHILAQTPGKGEGLATVFKSCFQCRLSTPVTYSIFELQVFKLSTPPPSAACSDIPSTRI